MASGSSFTFMRRLPSSTYPITGQGWVWAFEDSPGPYVTSMIVTLRLSPFNLGIKCENIIRSRWPLLDAGWVDVCGSAPSIPTDTKQQITGAKHFHLSDKVITIPTQLG